MKRWYRFRGLLLLVVAEMERTDTHTHEPSTVTLAAHARRGLITSAMQSINGVSLKEHWAAQHCLHGSNSSTT